MLRPHTAVFSPFSDHFFLVRWLLVHLSHFFHSQSIISSVSRCLCTPGLSLSLALSPPPPVCSASLSSDCIDDFSPFPPTLLTFVACSPHLPQFPSTPSILSFPHFFSFSHKLIYPPSSSSLTCVFFILGGVVTEDCNTVLSPPPLFFFLSSEPPVQSPLN